MEEQDQILLGLIKKARETKGWEKASNGKPGQFFVAACQNPAGKSSLAELVIQGFIQPQDCGWVWLEKDMRRVCWLGKWQYQQKTGDIIIVAPEAMLPVEKEYDQWACEQE